MGHPEPLHDEQVRLLIDDMAQVVNQHVHEDTYKSWNEKAERTLECLIEHIKDFGGNEAEVKNILIAIQNDLKPTVIYLFFLLKILNEYLPKRARGKVIDMSAKETAIGDAIKLKLALDLRNSLLEQPHPLTVVSYRILNEPGHN